MCELILNIFIHSSPIINIMVGLFRWRACLPVPVLLDNENLKTISSYKPQLGPRVSPLLNQLCEKLVLLEIIIL